MPDPDERLRRFLGSDPPEGIRTLSEPQRAELADLLDEARRAQTASLEKAFHATLKFVPFPVRGLVRKVLLG